MSAPPLKILLVGPSRARKSAVASFLSGVSESVGDGVGPTVGVRILECERAGRSVELWDVSGDQAYEGTWPAVQKDADGVLLLFDPEAEGQAREIELWHEWFVQKTGLPAERAAAWAVTPAPYVGSLPTIADGTSVESFSVDTAESMRRAFDRLISRVAGESAGGGTGGSARRPGGGVASIGRGGSAAPRR